MTDRLPPFAHRIGALRGRRRLAFGAALGVALATVQVPLSFYPAFLLALPVLFWLLAGAESTKAAAWVGWSAGVGYFSASLHWIVEPFLVDIARHGFLAPLALLGMGGGLALFWAVAFAVASRMSQGLLLAPALAATLSLAELGRSYLLTGFPWNLLAYGWLETPLAQTVALVGPHGLGFLTVLVAGLLGMGWRGWPVWTAALITLGLYGYGGQAVPDTAPLRQDGLVVRIVQPNATQETKWTADGMRAQYIRALQSTAQEGDYDVVIWPEAAVPQLVGEDARSWGGRLYQWQDIARVTQNRPALIGSRRVAWLEDPQWYNTLAVMTGGGVAQHYDKHHLVPFGEYIPLAQYLPGLGLQGLASALSNLGGSMQAGAGPRVIEAQGLPPFLPLICYEAIFPQHLRSAGPRPDWIVHVTNDAWFGNWVGPYQHLTQARFRAIEQGLPIARAANTGISAMIDPWGRIQSAIPLNTDGALDAPLPAPSNMPLYSKIGDGPFALGFGFVIGLLLVSRRYV